MFKLKNFDGKARIGVLKTQHELVKTPFFMPVATKGALKYLQPNELPKTQAIIANAFLLYLKPGLDVIKKFKNLHSFMNFQ